MIYGFLCQRSGSPRQQQIFFPHIRPGYRMLPAFYRTMVRQPRREFRHVPGIFILCPEPVLHQPVDVRLDAAGRRRADGAGIWDVYVLFSSHHYRLSSSRPHGPGDVDVFRLHGSQRRRRPSGFRRTAPLCRFSRHVCGAGRAAGVLRRTVLCPPESER